jgi:hypothetical protein
VVIILTNIYAGRAEGFHQQRRLTLKGLLLRQAHHSIESQPCSDDISRCCQLEVIPSNHFSPARTLVTETVM